MTVTSPLVSIVTPCLDPGPRLKRCLESVAAQIHDRVEHIVIDGGSTDGTKELLQDFDGIRWISEPDTGQTNALNKGFALAGGTILTWLNADDHLYPTAATEAVNTFATDPKVGLAYADFEEIEGERRSVIRTPARIGPRTFDFGNRFGPGTFFTRAAWDRAGPLDESFDLTMDFDLWLRMIDSGIHAVRIPHVLVAFEIHGESKTGTRGTHEFIFEEFKALAKNGRPRAAAVNLGRHAAAAQLESNRVSRAALEGAINEAIRSGLRFTSGLNEEQVRAGAFSEAALRARSWRGLTWLAEAEVWRMAPTRRRALLAIKAAIGGSLERLGLRRR